MNKRQAMTLGIFIRVILHVECHALLAVLEDMKAKNP
jgi:hypothetical protein